MKTAPNRTPQTAAVLRVLLEIPGLEMYGRQVVEATGLEAGTVYLILARLERIGWLDSRWERIDPAAAGRPRRHYFWLVPPGTHLARALVAEVARGPK